MENSVNYNPWKHNKVVIEKKVLSLQKSISKTPLKKSKYQKTLIKVINELENKDIKFYSSMDLRMYNKSVFETEISTRDNRTILVSKENITPFVAINDIYKNTQLYSFDCGEFIQIVHLITTHLILNKNKFNQLFTSKLKIEEFDTVGVKTNNIYTSNDGILWNKNNIPVPNISSSYLLIQASIGTRFSYSNKDAPTQSDYENENFIKIGENKYYAHPFGRNTLKNIKKLMANETWSTKTEVEKKLYKNLDEYINRNVYLSNAESFIEY